VATLAILARVALCLRRSRVCPVSRRLAGRAARRAWSKVTARARAGRPTCPRARGGTGGDPVCSASCSSFDDSRRACSLEQLPEGTVAAALGASPAHRADDLRRSIELAMNVDDEEQRARAAAPPPPSVFAALRQSMGATGSPSPNAASAGRMHVAHARARLDELLGTDEGSPSAQRHAEAMCAELARGADPNELMLPGGDDEVTHGDETGAVGLSVLQAACTWWWTDGCDYDPRPIVAALLRRGADPNLRCDPAMGPGSGFLRATEPRRRPTRRSAPSRSKWAGHTALWQTCALAFYSLHVSTSSEEHLWSPADAWLEAQRHAASSEEREEHAGSNRRRRKRWDTIGVLMFCPAPIHIIFVHKSAYIQLYI